MFIVLTRYREKFDPDDPHVKAHRDFLRAHAAAGRVVVSGPRNPRVGGATIYNVPTEQELRALLAQDPMHVAGMVDDEIVDFVATVAADEQHLDPSLTHA